MFILMLAAALSAAPEPPTCIAPDDTRVKLELALSDRDQALGLMYRDALAADAGMLFLFKDDQVRPFWMKNTMIALDMVWLDAHGRVVAMHERVPPCKADPCPSYDPAKPARAVVEFNGGFAAAHKVAVGSQLRFRQIDGYPIPETKR